MTKKIAIVGMGGVFPGARDLDEFWHNILAAKDAAIDVGADRWRLDPDDLYANELAPDKVNSRRACLIQDFNFDPEGFNVAPDLLLRLDPMYQILLQAGQNAWVDANTDKINKERVGIIIGNIVLPTESSSLFSDAQLKRLFEAQLNITAADALKHTDSLNRYVAGLPAGLLAKALGLGAGTYTLDAACAASFYALKYAVDELVSGRADAMLTGGVSRPDCLYTQMGFSQLNAISKSGQCAPFDSKADGLVVGEGAGIFVLKRLEDAIVHGDHIYATIAGIGLANDIAGTIMAPDTEGQVRAMQSAYANAGWSPHQVQHIECHGTGTPVGDAVEFRSLNNIWQQHGAEGECVIGSVKSNVGHLLTAAGAAALMKTLLAMKHGILPPTANYTSPADKIDLHNSPFKVLTQPEAWDVEAGEPRRAALSGFGFGGINAHVLLQAYAKEIHDPPATVNLRPVYQDIAIVGMATRLGPWHDQRAFAAAVLFGADTSPTQPEHEWGTKRNDCKAYVIDAVNVPLGRYRIPPAELKEMLPQQLLMLEVAANALENAGLSELTTEQQCRTGVFIGIALDLNTTNFHFRWMQKKYARAWLQDLGIHLYDNELNEWIAHLRAASGPALNANRTMGALGGAVASRIARTFRIGGPSFTVSAEDTSGLRALELGLRALQKNELDQVIVGAVDLASDLRAVKGHIEHYPQSTIADGATAFILKRHEDALRDDDQVYSVIKGFGAAFAGCNESGVTQSAQMAAMENACSDAQIHLNDIDQISFSTASEHLSDISILENIKTNHFQLGHVGAATGLMSVAGAVSALHHHIRPKAHESNARFWLKDKIQGPRRSLVNATSLDGNSVSVVLQEGDMQPISKLPTARLFTVSATDLASLVRKLKTLAFDIKFVQDKKNNPFRIAFLAKDDIELKTAIDEALIAIKNNTSCNNEKCFYTTDPLANKGKIAFVYPGSGNHFWGMGQELSIAFPEVLKKLDAENETLASQFAKGRFWEIEEDKTLTHEALIFGQVCLGTFVSDVVSHFGIKPDAVIGYSLGETVGLFSTRTWTARDEMMKRIQASTLFTEKLAGPCTAVQKVWGSEAPVDWAVGVINTSADKVETVLAHHEHVYLLIINTPHECVIGGDRKALHTAVKELAAQYHPLAGVTTVHCEVVKPVAKEYRDLHLFATTPPRNVTFYSGIRGGAYAVTQDSAADSIVEQALAPFDYTKVIQSAYADGVRLFIEMGPGESCTRMIDQILGQNAAGGAYFAKALCVKGQDSVDNILALLARLYAEGVAIDLSQLDRTEEIPGEKYKSHVSIKTGGDPCKVPLPRTTRQKESTVIELNSKQSKADIIEQQDISSLPMVENGDLQPMIQQMQRSEIAHAKTQETFLRVSQGMTKTLEQALYMQLQLIAGGNIEMPIALTIQEQCQINKATDCQFNRAACLEFATGSIGKLLGERFADIDQYPSRVRLPDEPLMLVDRILEVHGKADGLTDDWTANGRVMTEHDILPAAWYLDLGRIPTCIAVEAGQADLFLTGYLGIDHITKGLAVYRLLDACITFHGSLPTAGQKIRYDIHIEHFFRQGDTWLFRFNFVGTVNGQTLLTMSNGCAGFFTRQVLDAGQGLVLTRMEKQSAPGTRTKDWRQLVAMRVESYNDEQLNALRTGDLAACFGKNFAHTGLTNLVGLPAGRMTLVHRILKLDPDGGRFGIGQITGEADIRPDDWFLICHFVDDRVMPGTLMYECCLHTLRVYLLRMGWIGTTDEFIYEPVIDQISQLKCRGQITEKTKAVQYEITLKEIGYLENGTPYVLAEALIYGDHRAIVQIKNMSVQLSGLQRERLEARWANQAKTKQILFDNDSILAFAVGKPSAAFGDRYKVFDSDRRIARLPGPPYKFIDHVTAIKDCEPWVMQAGGVIEAEYDVPADAWYFTEDNQPYMPFAVLLEVALQPCGWLAAYLGSALSSATDLSFRNLGGKATQYLMVQPDIGTLSTVVKITNVSQSGDMIIQNFDYAIYSDLGMVYKGDTYFGFFSHATLAEQVGIRGAAPYQANTEERASGRSCAYPTTAPMPADMMRMIDEISLQVPDGGPNGLGFIEGIAHVKKEAWFFKAHFHQDPVWPGSLGLESCLQLLKVFAVSRWQDALTTGEVAFESMARNQTHEWIYRGQILPVDDTVLVQAVITAIDDQTRTLKADGFLTVDGRIIYQMKDFALRIT